MYYEQRRIKKEFLRWNELNWTEWMFYSIYSMANSIWFKWANQIDNNIRLQFERKKNHTKFFGIKINRIQQKPGKLNNMELQTDERISIKDWINTLAIRVLEPFMNKQAIEN